MGALVRIYLNLRATQFSDTTGVSEGDNCLLGERRTCLRVDSRAGRSIGEPVVSGNSIHLSSLRGAMIKVEQPAQPLSASHGASTAG